MCVGRGGRRGGREEYLCMRERERATERERVCLSVCLCEGKRKVGEGEIGVVGEGWGGEW